jgi:transcriptional regulator with XRE-family HTH domain
MDKMEKRQKNGSKAIRRLLRERGWSQSDLAREIGVTRGTICRILSGTRRVSADVALVLHRKYGIPLEDLLQ